MLFLKFIHEHLQRRALPDSVVRERTFHCPKCGEPVEDRRAVQRRLKHGDSTIRCQYCDTPIPLSDLLETRFGDPELVARVRSVERTADEKRGYAVGVTTANAKQEINEYDVFLAHNGKDTAPVEAIGNELKRRGVNQWLDVWNLPPGRMFQQELQQVLPKTRAGAIFVGPHGLGPWEEVEMYSAISQFVKERRPVIPVLLPGLSNAPPLPPFLGEFKWVEFPNDVNDPHALELLCWGITGKQA